MRFRKQHALTEAAMTGRMGVVLVVDDDPINRDLACRMLGTDYMVQSAADGREALRLAANTSPDVMVVTGATASTTEDVLRARRRDPEMQRIPVVVWGNENGEMPEEVETTVAAVMHGPLAAESLRKTVATALANR